MLRMPLLWRAPAAVLLWCLGAALLPQRCQAEEWDIQLQLYRDPVCIERVEDVLLMEHACYANLYSNLTKAFSLKIIKFTFPQSLEIREFSDNCQTLALGARPMTTGGCVRFLGGLWVSARLLFRSKTCIGECSKLGISQQQFFEEKDCQGRPYTTYWYPTPGCLRSFNGTQELSLSTDSRGTNITMTDYTYNSGCNGGIIKVYDVESGTCFPLYEDRSPRSFKWVASPATSTGYTGGAAVGAAEVAARQPGLMLQSLLSVVALSSGVLL